MSGILQSLFAAVGANPQVVSSTQASYASGTPRTINVPSGVQAGDFVITIHSMASDSSNDITSQTGFTDYTDVGAQTFPKISIFYKTATGADSGTYSFTPSSSATDSASVCIVLRGVTGTLSVGTATTNDSGADVSTPSTSVSDNNTLLLGLFMRRIASSDTGTITSPPADMSLVQYASASGNEARLAVYSQVVNAASYTKSITFSTSPGAGFYNAARLLMVR